MRPISSIKDLIRRVFRQTPERAQADRPWWDQDETTASSQSSTIPVLELVVTDRVFLLGLDELYRSAMKRHERTELLAAARRVAAVLHQEPADLPVEGYYSEDPDLTTYFRLMRALQAVPLGRAAEVQTLPAFQRLLAVTSSPLFGRPVREYLIPTGSDPLSEALQTLAVPEWRVPRLTTEAARVARASGDFSLVGLAARAEDAVVLAALRESVVLYAYRVLSRQVAPPRHEYVWRVDPALAKAAHQFVATFNGLFGNELPPPTGEYARIFWEASISAHIVGRCARLGQANRAGQHYHWAVRLDPAGQLSVHDFWHDEIITTERYRSGNL